MLFLGMAKSKKQQSFSPEKIADLYLAALANGEEVFLNAFLVKHKIYHDIDILNQVMHLLLESDLVEEEGRGFSIFSYNAPGTILTEISGNILTIPQFEITDKGRHFIAAGQELDSKAVAERKAAKQKNNERLVNAGISFGTAVMLMLIKWFFIDKK
jgi:hypothetical protein